jgi:hypothetical protein
MPCATAPERPSSLAATGGDARKQGLLKAVVSRGTAIERTGAATRGHFADATPTVLIKNNIVAGATQGMISLGGRSEKVRK